MKITRIKQIKNIGTYKDSGAGRIELKPFTFIYAANTYGKTTFCDIIRSLKTNDISYINNRRRIGIKDTEKCLVSLTIDGNNVNYDGIQWIKPMNIDFQTNIEVFDINFVNENVFTNFKIEHKNKESFTSFILGERGVELIQTLEEFEKTLYDKEQKLKEDKQKLEKLLNNCSYDIIKRQPYKDDFKDIDCLLFSFADNIKKLTRQLSEIEKIKKLEKIDNVVIDFSNILQIIKQVQEICNFRLDIDLKQLKNKIEIIKKDIPTLTDQWIKEGIKISKDKCPLCGNDITNNERIKVLSEYFSETIINLLDQIEKCHNDILKKFNCKNFFNCIVKCTQQKNPISSYYNIQTDLNKKADTILDELTNKATIINQLVDDAKEELLDNLSSKMSSVNKTEFDFSRSTILIDTFNKINALLEDLNKATKIINEDFEQYQNKLSNEYLLKEIEKNQKEYDKNNLLFQRGKYNEEINSLIQTEDHIKELKTKIKETRATIDLQQEEFLNKYFEKIQSIYSKLGGDNYRIEREATSRGKKKVYGVKIYFMGKLIDETRFCMSESDRRALALSVFLAKIQVDNNPNLIMLLDDPVTSFDQNRMRNFIDIINILNKECCEQIIILMHYESFFRLAAKAIDDKTLIKIVREKDNHAFCEIDENDDMFSSEYEQALRHIVQFIQAETNTIKENDVRIFIEKYLHNYYAYEIAKQPSIKGARLHDFILGLEKEKLISTQEKETLLLKLKFLNDSSHSFTDYPIEEQRSFIEDVYTTLHNLGATNESSNICAI